MRMLPRLIAGWVLVAACAETSAARSKGAVQELTAVAGKRLIAAGPIEVLEAVCEGQPEEISFIYLGADETCAQPDFVDGKVRQPASLPPGGPPTDMPFSVPEGKFACLGVHEGASCTVRWTAR